MNYGIIDIGSNTIRCNVYLVENGDFRLLFNKKFTAGLASYIEDGLMTRKGINKLIRTLRSIQKMTDQVHLEELYAFATASLRKVNNSKEILKEVYETLGISIDLLPEKKEAALGFLGITSLIDGKKGISCDIGGGSTEIVLFKKGKVKDIINLDEGSLSSFREFVDRVVPRKKEIRNMKSSIRETLAEYRTKKEFDTLIGIGGSIRAAGNVIQEIWGLEEGEPFKVKLAKELLRRIRNQDRETIHTILKVAPARIHTFTPGLIILLEVCKHFSVKEVQVCKYGLREGYLIEKLEARK